MMVNQPHERFCNSSRVTFTEFYYGHRDEFYRAEEGRILGSEEFVDATIHRIGETKRVPERNGRMARPEFNGSALLTAVEKGCGIAKEGFCGSGKTAELIRAKEILVLVGRQVGASVKTLAELTGINSSGVSRRYDAAREKLLKDPELAKVAEKIERAYWK